MTSTRSAASKSPVACAATSASTREEVNAAEGEDEGEDPGHGEEREAFDQQELVQITGGRARPLQPAPGPQTAPGLIGSAPRKVTYASV
jgi:hypothetical protein